MIISAKWKPSAKMLQHMNKRARWVRIMKIALSFVPIIIMTLEGLFVGLVGGQRGLLRGSGHRPGPTRYES